MCHRVEARDDARRLRRARRKHGAWTGAARNDQPGSTRTSYYHRSSSSSGLGLIRIRRQFSYAA
jgi:hypothetical protein